MTTRSEWFRYFAERVHPAAAAPAPGPQPTARPRVPPRAAYRLEVASGKPSRKSTRRSANRQKTDVQFRMKRRTAETRSRPPPP
jgi:hypothetical protein